MTKLASVLAARAEALPQGSSRRRLLEGARRFKAAWVEFGRLLSEVKHEGLWREWGYASFERYCTKELFIRASTAEKLTASFGFLERHEPDLARSRTETDVPPFEVIDVLSRAEADGRLSHEGWREIRDEVLTRPASRSALNRWIAERVGTPPATKGPPAGERLGRIAAQARRLASLCRGEAGVPGSLADRAADLAEALDALSRGGVPRS